MNVNGFVSNDVSLARRSPYILMSKAYIFQTSFKELTFIQLKIQRLVNLQKNIHVYVHVLRKIYNIKDNCDCFTFFKIRNSQQY